LYTRRGREKTQEEFAGAAKGADGQKDWQTKGVMKQKVQKSGQQAK
jgi:hypothetical protein